MAMAGHRREPMCARASGTRTVSCPTRPPRRWTPHGLGWRCRNGRQALPSTPPSSPPASSTEEHGSSPPWQQGCPNAHLRHLPALLRPGKFPIVTREGLCLGQCFSWARSRAQPAAQQASSSSDLPAAPTVCPAPGPAILWDTEGGDEAGPVRLMTRTFLASSGRTGAR